MEVERISVFKYWYQKLKNRYGDTVVELYGSKKAKQALFFALNFLAATALFYSAFPSIPILLMIAFAIATVSRVVPKLALAMALCIFAGYAFILRMDLGFMELVLGLVLLIVDTRGRHDEWLFITLITPLCVQVDALYAPAFLAMVLVKEDWASTSFVAIMQTAFLATFMGHYPWLRSDLSVQGPFSHAVADFSGSLAHQFNTMYTYKAGGIVDYLGNNLFFLLTFIAALKVITTLAGHMSFDEKDGADRKRQELTGMAAGAGLSLVLTIALGYLCAGRYAVPQALLTLALSFTPVFFTSAVTGSLVKLATFSELNKRTGGFSWDSIAGYEDVKDEIKEAIFPYTDETTYRRIEEMNLSIVKGILLYGPTGVGKTLFAQVMAAEAHMHFITVKCTDFMSKWVGESESQLKGIFAQARNQTPCIIFFDEIEAFLSARDSEVNNYTQMVVTTFLAEMDGFEKLKDVLVIGATNYPNKIDPAVIRPGRFDKIIYIPHPDEEARKKIFQLYLKDKPVTDSIDLNLLAHTSERYTPADICAVITEAYRASNYTAVSNHDLLNLIKHNKATMTYQMLETYNAFAARFGRRKFSGGDDGGGSARRLRWNHVAGMDEAKHELQRYIEFPLKNADVYDHYRIRQSKGALLFGPPGCGKTLLVKALADECGVTFIPVKCSEVLRAYTGQTESNVQDLFRKAKENRPAILFFDELDAFAEKRGSGDTKIVEQLLTELDAVEELKQVFILGATNRIGVIDEALLRPGRFDKLIYIGLPDEAARKALLEMSLAGRPHTVDAAAAAVLTAGYTGAEIDYLVNRAAILAAEDFIRGIERPIGTEDMMEALGTTSRSVAPEDVEHYRDISRRAR